MKTLYIAPVNENSTSINGGYDFIANSFNKLFLSLTDRGIVHSYTYVNPSLQKDKVALYGEYDIGIVLCHFKSFENPNFKKNIENLRKHCKTFYFHWFWEVDKLPSASDWMFKDDSMFTGFIASSEFNKKLIIKKVSNCNKRFYKVYPFIEDTLLHIKIEDKLNEDKFNVLYMGQYTKRKGFEDAIIAFAQALGDKEDCNLYLKYHRLSQIEFNDDDMIKRTIAMNCTNFKAHVYSITDNLNREQINDLYKDSSVLLFLSRGEGFGLPLLEASIVGLPIIYADNSSCNEVVQDQQFKVPCISDSAVCMSQYRYESDSNYGVPIMKHAINNLKKCYEQWKTNKSLYYESTNGKTLLKLFSEDNIVKQLKELL